MQLAPLRPRRRRPSAAFAHVAQEVVTAPPTDLTVIAGRLAGLIDGPVTEALAVLLTELYGDALKRIVATIATAPAGEALLERLCDDRLVGGLLVVHDLHPRPLTARVERALARVAQTAARDSYATLERIEEDIAYVRLAPDAGPAAHSTIVRAIADVAPEISCVCAEFDVAAAHAIPV